MVFRTPKNQSTHDRKVRETANRYKREGWKVTADVPGYKSPKIINRKQPDIVVKKGRKTKIFEIETHKSMKTDKPQRAVFRKFARKKPNTTFKTLIAKKRDNKNE